MTVYLPWRHVAGIQLTERTWSAIRKLPATKPTGDGLLAIHQWLIKCCYACAIRTIHGKGRPNRFSSSFFFLPFVHDETAKWWRWTWANSNAHLSLSLIAVYHCIIVWPRLHWTFIPFSLVFTSKNKKSQHLLVEEQEKLRKTGKKSWKW